MIGDTSKPINRHTAITPLLALGLAACGGGGSSSSTPQEQPRGNGGNGNGGNNPPPPLMLPDEVPLAIYENHPTNKAAAKALKRRPDLKLGG